MSRRPLVLILLVSTIAALGAAAAASGQGAAAPVAGGYDIHRATAGPAICNVGFANSYFSRDDCGFANVTISGADAGASVTARFLSQTGALLGTAAADHGDGEEWGFDIAPEADWPAGPITIRMRVGSEDADGDGTFFLNTLGASLAPEERAGGYRPGDDIPVTGKIFEQRGNATGGTDETGVAATFKLRLVDASGQAGDELGPFTAAADGTVEETVPGSATQDIHPGRSTDWAETVRLELVDATFDDGDWAAPDGTSAGSLRVSEPPTELVLENSFVSSKGWVKPGEAYPFTLRVENFTASARTNAVVTIDAPDGTAFTGGDPGSLTWTAGTVPAAGADGSPGVETFVGEAKADTLAQDPEIVWKDLSTTARLTYDGGPGDIARASHGPKVIPAAGGYDTARYGDRPFPVVPVDYADRSHEDGNSAGKLASKINDPDLPGSTRNLYQEMSYGQLFPNGTVPSDGVASADWTYGKGFQFTKNTAKPDTCHGITGATLPGDQYQQLQPRIENGWYQLPGTTDYYGDDSKGSALIGAQAGVGALQDIDSACGPAGKAVYDAAQIADPEIDYSDYDTDKDGVVDFFMMVFPGVGGNGVSQTEGVPPYDNIWPHSADLQNQFTDAGTGEKGYISDDQLRDLENRALFWTDESRTQKTTNDTGIPVFVRVGPYNVNPESAIDKASVISHEYGHSLGLPDYYSTGTRETYGTWTLMAEDHSQNIDIVGKKELGWVVPRVLEPGQTREADGWEDTKKNTHRIDWKTPGGEPYSLTGAGVNNGEAYAAALPGRKIIDEVPSGSHAYWSRQGNDFGCTPEAGHNLDIAVPALRDVPAGTPVTLTFKSRWDVEWDFDYGFVMTTTDSGKTYVSHPSEKGYTTGQAENPNSNACQAKYGNGITGASGSYEAGTQTVDRVAGNYPGAPFLDDSYDLSDLAGKSSVVRFSYATDPGLARPGWFIDDVKVTAGDTVIYSSDFEDVNDPGVFNGGCRESLQTAQTCTDGWQSVTAGGSDPAEHAYLVEMRDRSGFDATGQGESDRGDPTFAPGVLLAYTDENHGYGNVGTDDPPAQSPLDSQPQPGEEAPNLDDAAFTAAAGDSSFSDAGDGHVDNYTDPRRADGQWRFDFDCLGFQVKRLAGSGIGPATAGSYDLNGDVTFKTGTGCGRFDFGDGPEGNGAPTAVADAKPRTVKAGETVAFDGSGSSDDRDAPESLKYAWDFDGNGTKDADGRGARHAYAAGGVYGAKLTVTDTGGKTGSATVKVTVTGGSGAAAGGAGTPTGGSGGGSPLSVCAATSAFRSVKATPRGRGVRFAFARRSRGGVKVEVFRASTRSRVIRTKRVARFTGKTRSFTWSGRGAGNGYYFARFSLKGDTRRIALVRRGGRFHRAPAYARKDGCGAIRAFKLERPAFGGSGAAKLPISFRLARTGRARVDVLRGKKVVRRLSNASRRGNRTYRLSLPAKGLKRGLYRVRLRVGKTTAVLAARRL